MVTGNIGERFPVATDPVGAERVDTWRVLGAAGEHAVSREFGQEGRSVAAPVRLPGAGTYLGVMTIKPRDIEMTGEEFTQYLREEGLGHILRERARRGLTAASARERYARYAKIVIANGDGPATYLFRPVGIAAELLPLRNPASLKRGDTLALQLLVHGRPVGGVRVTAVSDNVRINQHTDSEGVVGFPITTSGEWLIKTVHMTQPLDSSAPVDWESYWVTLAFTVPLAATQQ